MLPTDTDIGCYTCAGFEGSWRHERTDALTFAHEIPDLDLDHPWDIAPADAVLLARFDLVLWQVSEL